MGLSKKVFFRENECRFAYRNAISGIHLCLSGEQAQVVQEIGVDCSSAEILSDPYGTSCLMASLSNDESTCESTVDEDARRCSTRFL